MCVHRDVHYVCWFYVQIEFIVVFITVNVYIVELTRFVLKYIYLLQWIYYIELLRNEKTKNTFKQTSVCALFKNYHFYFWIWRILQNQQYTIYINNIYIYLYYSFNNLWYIYIYILNSWLGTSGAHKWLISYIGYIYIYFYIIA